MSEDLIKFMSESSSRIVITQSREFNPRRKKENIVLTDIRGKQIVKEFCSAIKIDVSSKGGCDWMTLPKIYLNFLDEKILIFSIGILFDGWVRSSSWEGDYVIKNAVWFHEWLIDNGVSYFEGNT